MQDIFTDPFVQRAPPIRAHWNGLFGVLRLLAHCAIFRNVDPQI